MSFSHPTLIDPYYPFSRFFVKINLNILNGVACKCLSGLIKFILKYFSTPLNKDAKASAVKGR